VSGDVVVTEVTPVAVPNLLQDTLRGDNQHLLDADGSVVVVGAASLPAAALTSAPSWKQAGVTASGATPWFGYTGPAIAGIVVGSVAAGVVMTLLAVFGFRRLRRDAKKHGLQEP
jgi:subtilisin family serine protease